MSPPFVAPAARTVRRRGPNHWAGSLASGCCLSLVQPAWVYATVDRLVHREDVKLAVVVLAARHCAAMSRESRLRHLAESGLVAAFERLDERFSRPSPEPFALRNLAPLLAKGMPTVMSELVPAHGCWQLPLEDVEMVRSANLDALVYFGEERPFCGGILAAAHHGLWCFRHGSPPPYEGAPSGFWETVAGELTATSALVAVTDRGVEEELWTSVLATHPTSAALTRAALYWTSTLFPERALASIRDGETTARTPVEQVAAPGPSLPRDASTACASRTLTRHLPHFLVRAGRKGVMQRVKKLLAHDQWYLALTWADEALVPSLANAQRLVPPKDRLWADPHVVHREGRYYAFVEELPFSRDRGHIAVLILDRSGLVDGPITVLERPYHLSHPFLFEHAGDLYMIPETVRNRTIELYRCAEFPAKWEFVRNLMEHVTAVDTTLLRREGRWWLFTCMKETEGAGVDAELFLFASSDPVTGEWRSHPRNPIVSDVRKARPAGQLFEQHGRLYRPSQQGVPRYGYAVRLNEILCLTDEEYKETDAGCLLPNWERGLVGTHTLSRADDLTIVDACRWRSRFV